MRETGRRVVRDVVDRSDINAILVASWIDKIKRRCLKGIS